MRKSLLLMTVISFLVIGCASQESMYKKAVKTNKVEDFKYYLEEYPEGKFAEKAKYSIAEIEFRKAEKTNTIDAYKQFIQKYRDNRLTQKAKNSLVELEFESVKKIDTVEAYESFLEQYPETQFADSARVRLEALYFQQAEERDNIEFYETLIMRYPESRYKEQAKSRLQFLYERSAEEERARIEQRRYMEALEADLYGTYERFLTDYPNSRYREEIQDNLKGFERFKIKRDISLSNQELKQRYNWNGVFLVVPVNPKGSFMCNGFKATGRVYIGNLQVEGSFEQETNGLKLYKGTEIIYKR